LFLLDGLDEVVDRGQRREVGQRIEKFALAHSQCRMLVTSRLVGYREAQLGGEFSQFTISPFEEDEVRRFAQNWYAALGIAGGAEELVKAIQGNPSVRRLASNPLLLTVIALIHWRGTELPSHRVTLYRLAAETLVDQWMRYRRVTPEGWDVHETLQVLLPAIAWHLHSTTSSGLIGQLELHDLLVDTLRQHDTRLSEKEAHSRVSQFRRNVSEFSGIFLERGLDQNGRGIYGFLHLTFEEYFAALRLADTWQREGERMLKPLLHDPRWTETILLTAGHFGEFTQYQATRFVQTILEAQSEYENFLHRDLLLAARCLADDVRVDAELRRVVLSKLIKCYFARESPPALQEDIEKILARFSGTIVEKDVLKALSEHLAKRNKGVLRAASVLGRMGAAAATPEVLAALLMLLSDADREGRRMAALVLGRMGAAAATPEVLAALLTLLSDADREGRGAAAWALGRMGAAATMPEVPATLLTPLSDANGGGRGAAAEALGEMRAAATPEVLAALLTFLSDADGGRRWAAAEALGEMEAAAATPEVLAALLTLLSDTDRKVRGQAARTLKNLSVYVRPQDRSAAIKLFLPLARSRDMEHRDIGYVGLRNLLAAGPA
jgi:HEAT repeat protein